MSQMAFNEDLQELVEHALESHQGKLHLENVQNYLSNELSNGKFNSQRAMEVFGIAVDNSMWDFLDDISLKKAIYRDYKSSGIGSERANRLTSEFIEKTGARDQRPARRLFRWLLGA